MHRPVTTAVWLVLTRKPSHSLQLAKGNLQLDRPFDPLALLELPTDAEALGEFALGCWDWTLGRLETETDIPATFVRERMERFRAQGYAQANTLRPQRIVGSRAKARIHGVVTCARTVLRVEVSHRKEPLFERMIWDVPDLAFGIAYTPREIAVEDSQLKVREASLGLLPEAAFPLDSLPSAFLRTLT